MLYKILLKTQKTKTNTKKFLYLNIKNSLINLAKLKKYKLKRIVNYKIKYRYK